MPLEVDRVGLARGNAEVPAGVASLAPPHGNKTRVLIVFSSSELGGAERSLTRMALAVPDSVDYDMATLDGEGPWSAWCRTLGGTPLVLGERRAGRGHGRFGLRALARLVGLVRSRRPALIYVIGLRASLLLRLVKPWLRGALLVQGVRWNPNSDSRLDRAFRAVERMLGGLIDLYICNSRIAAHTLNLQLHIPLHRIQVIYNGLEKSFTAPMSLSVRPMQVLTIANLSPRKGYLEYLEQVVAPLSKKLPGVRFVLVGRDEMAGAVQNKIAELGLGQIVACIGFQQDVSTFLNDARVFVMPSLWNEGCPTSILEAMAYGLPPVAFELDGIPELIVHETDGILVPMGDYDRMRSEIESLLQDPERAIRLGEHGRDKVLAHFGIETAAVEHAKAFSNLLQEQRT